MKHKQPGVSMIVFLIAMFGLMITITHVWRTITYSVDIVLSRQASYQAFYCTEGIRVWAVEFVKHNFSNLCNDFPVKSNPLIFELKWPIEVSLLSDAICNVSIQRITNDEFKIIAACNHVNASCLTTCLIRKQNKNSKESFILSKWSIDTI
jgi:hypothetical protein